MTQWDFAWYVCICVCVAGSSGLWQLHHHGDSGIIGRDAGVSTALAAERSNMATTKPQWTATRLMSGFMSNKKRGKMSSLKCPSLFFAA